MYLSARESLTLALMLVTSERSSSELASEAEKSVWAVSECNVNTPVDEYDVAAADNCAPPVAARRELSIMRNPGAVSVRPGAAV